MSFQHTTGTSTGAGSIRRRPLTADIHCPIATPERQALMRDFFPPDKRPLTRFPTPETNEINLRMFAGVAPQLISTKEGLIEQSLGVS